ncbi:Hypothetical predicted protein [Mytilus galloprovincialis]|uniref:C1q domain-containing protein n=1 Tax=Mytilus galloprovincialis TaxID=29158 RepID=A0A8B6D724_MYTGA|nr:Hypothetical predicted protein [Mytilus galloprovincialis]
MDFILKLCLMFVLLQVVPSKSIRNNTDTDSKMDLMENSLENMEQRILNLTNQVTKLSKRKKDEHVMFYATLASDTVLNINSIVRFNEIQYDEGADFNSGTGVFVSSVSGVYMFAWTIRTYNGKTIDTELKVDNVVKARQILQGIHSTRIQTSQFVICRVNEGDHVWIETGQGVTSENFFNEYHGSKSSFMGILIHRL